MKLNDLTGLLVAHLDPTQSAAELQRALREQSEHFIDKDLPEGITTEVDSSILRAPRTGPRGGLDADPFRASFMLVAIMMNGMKSDIADRVWRAWHLVQQGSVLSGFGEDWKPTVKLCPLTHKFLFGDALKATLSDPRMAERVNTIRIRLDCQMGEFVYDNGKASRFKDHPEQKDRPENEPPLMRTAELEGEILVMLSKLLARS